MLISAPNLDALFIAFSKNFEDSYMSVPQPLLDNIGSKIPSNTRDQRYPFVQALSGAMRQWTGERQINNVVLDGFVCTNLKWENTLAISRVDLEDDQYDAYSNMLIPNLARHAKLLPDQQIALAITNGTTTLGYDSVDFFSTAHPVDPSNTATTTSGGSTTQSNLLTGKPLNATNLAIVQAQMMNFQGPDALPMGNEGNVILVPPSLKYVADNLANAAWFPEAKNAATGVFGNQQSIIKGQYSVVTSPWLTDSGDPTTAVWYLLDCNNPALRPFFWQERVAPQLISLVDPSNPTVFFQDIYYMGARARGAALASLWFKAIRVSGA